MHVAPFTTRFSVALIATGFAFSLPGARAADLIVLKPHTGLKPFEYAEAPDALPNYVAGAQWGTQTDPIRSMQKPLDPAESALHITLPEGFEARLFAAEPDITKPIALAWDAQGRLWVAETVDYPNEMRPAGEGRDRIRICEDTDGDGRADRFTIFADKLSIPTSLVFADGGVIVAQAPDMLFLKDTNGDGRADVRKVLFTGWGTQDTHAGPSNLRYGFDNWIWGTVGYSGFDGEVGGRHHKFGMGIYRFKPDGSELEFIRSSNNNTWGLGLSEEGTVFGSTANGNASMYMAVPNRFYEAVSGWSAAWKPSRTTSRSTPSRPRSARLIGMAATPPGPAMPFTPRAVSRATTGTGWPSCVSPRAISWDSSTSRRSAPTSRPTTAEASSPATTSGPPLWPRRSDRTAPSG
jgi:hypothetical protein